MLKITSSIPYLFCNRPWIKYAQVEEGLTTLRTQEYEMLGGAGYGYRGSLALEYAQQHEGQPGAYLDSVIACH